MNSQSEIKCQYEALNQISRGDNEIAGKYCEHDNMIIAVEFRQIITEYKINYNCVPTADELIWLTSEKLGFDISKLY